MILRHEPEIDKSLLELRTRAGDMFFLYWQKAASYGQTRVFDILQYIASQSNPPPPTQVVVKMCFRVYMQAQLFSAFQTCSLLNDSLSCLKFEDRINFRICMLLNPYSCVAMQLHKVLL